MKRFLIFLFIIKFSCAFAQNNEVLDTIEIGYGASVYSYANSTNFKSGGAATGISIFFPSKKFSLQLGLLYDWRTHEAYFNYLNGCSLGGHICKPDKVHNLFFPVLGHYNYYSRSKLNLFLTGGFIFGGRYYIDENNYNKEGSTVSYSFGAGISYRLFKNIYFRACPNLRRANEIFYPGLLLDISVLTKLN